MGKAKVVTVKKEKVVDGFYKGYDLSWLKENPEHPDYHLVAEAEGLDAKPEEVVEEPTEEVEAPVEEVKEEEVEE